MSTLMRQFVGSAYGSLDAFAITEGDISSPAEEEVRIRIEAAALGFVDGLIALGRYQIRPPLPYVPGGEIAGIVDAVGPSVDTFSVGDRVVTWQLGGGLAEYVNASRTYLKFATKLESAEFSATFRRPIACARSLRATAP